MARAAQKDHPSPHRDAIRLASLVYGLVAAPAAWMVAQVVASGLAQRACFPTDEPLAAPAFPGVQGLSGAVLLLALAVGVSAAWTAYSNWRKTRLEQAGDGHALLQVGEGRSRFMAFAGLLTSLGFTLAAVFSLAAVFPRAGLLNAAGYKARRPVTSW